jgi:ubiquinone/menaquinone biosynthesis C-methylase UbiE
MNIPQHIEQTRLFHEDDYKIHGLSAQRNYPNEELCRFMGREFFKKPRSERSRIKILETGCGSGANLWMLAQEGFSTYGLDISSEGLKVCKERLIGMGLNAQLECASMTKMPYTDQYFDAVVDVFSSHCLDLENKKLYLDEVSRVLKTDGLFYSYHPSKNSDAYKDHAPARLIDESTLNAILRPTSAYYRYEHTYCFLSPEQYTALCKDVCLDNYYMELIGRTYRSQHEYFEFLSAAFKKS